MTLQTSYHAITFLTAAFGCGTLGLIFGYGWGYEACQADVETAEQTRAEEEAARREAAKRRVLFFQSPDRKAS